MSSFLLLKISNTISLEHCVITCGRRENTHLHRSWCNLFICALSIAIALVPRATIKPVQQVRPLGILHSVVFVPP